MFDFEFLSEYAALMGMDSYSWNPWDVAPSILPKNTKCHFCKVNIDSLEMYAILTDIVVYAHIGCIEKALDKRL